MLTIISADGSWRAIIEETEDGIEAKYYRNVHNDRRGYEPGTKPGRRWDFVRSTTMRSVPFHVALDTAHAIVHGARR